MLSDVLKKPKESTEMTNHQIRQKEEASLRTEKENEEAEEKREISKEILFISMKILFKKWKNHFRSDIKESWMFTLSQILNHNAGRVNLTAQKHGKVHAAHPSDMHFVVAHKMDHIKHSSTLSKK